MTRQLPFRALYYVLGVPYRAQWPHSTVLAKTMPMASNGTRLVAGMCRK